MTATVSDREDKLARREKELARIRDEMKRASFGSNDLDSKLTQAQADRVKLEAEVAELQLQLSTLLSGGDVDKAVASLQQERDRQAERLATLVRENKKLKADLSAYERDKSEDWDEQRRDNAMLREQINDLAAEVVRLTETLDGPESPISAALETDVPEQARPATAGERRPTSLAERVRALKQASAAR